MNIAHIVPQSITFPLQVHNGRYQWVVHLARMQARSGHNVTIYCNKHSVLDHVNTDGITTVSINKKMNNIATLELALSNPHDIYHSHFDNLHYEIAKSTSKQIVATQHWWPSDETIQLAKTTDAKNVWAVPPTKYMSDFDLQSGIQTKGFIHHGIDLSFFNQTAAKKTNRLLFVGRVSPEKNIDIAINSALGSGFGLDIIGKITTKNHDYWQQIKPRIDGNTIRYLGPKSQEEIIKHYASARGVIFPSDTNEAFGLVAIESQACGTPVIMKRGGSRGELVHDRKTGFLCDTLPEFIDAINDLSAIDPAACVRFASQFSDVSMTLQYESLYKEIVSL